MSKELKKRDNKDILWEDKKRTIFGLPLSFTKYTLTEDVLYVRSGILTKREEEIRLYRIVDITLTATLGERIFNTGSILVESSDRSMPQLILESIKNSASVKDQLSNLVEQSRRNVGVVNLNSI